MAAPGGWQAPRLLPGGWAQLLVADGPLAPALAARMGQHLAERQAQGLAMRLALAGGRTPEAAYRLLGQQALPWPDISLGFGDERVAPGEAEGSNWAMARAAFGPGPCAQAKWHRFADSEAEAARLQAEGPYPLVLLGLGTDGHTASLFPGSPALEERERLALDAPGVAPWPERRTLGLRAIAEAEAVWVAIDGAAKAPVLAQLWAGEPLVLAQVLKGRDPARTLLLVDAEAAAGLP